MWIASNKAYGFQIAEPFTECERRRKTRPGRWKSRDGPRAVEALIKRKRETAGWDTDN